MCKNLFKKNPPWNCQWFSHYFYLCECIFAMQLWLKIIAHIGKLSHFKCISKTECVDLYRRQTSYSTGEAESAIYVYMFVMGHLLTQKLTKYNLFRLLVHSSPKTIYIYMYKWKKINMLFKNCCHFNSTTKCVFNGVVSLVQKEFSSNLSFHLCILEYLVNYVALLEEHNVRDDWIWIWLWSWISSWTKKWLHMTNKCYYHQMKSSF